MARKIGPTVEILMRRVQQEGGIAVDPDFATRIYSLCTQIINTYKKSVLATSVLTTPKEKLIYHYRAELPLAIDITMIRDASTGRRIERFLTFRELFAYNYQAMRKIDGTRFEAWGQIGRDLLILYPGQTAISSVSVTYVLLLTEYTNFDASYNTENQLPDEEVELAINLAELILLTRFRQLPAVRSRLELFKKQYQGEVK